jgi:hypothetical protein
MVVGINEYADVRTRHPYVRAAWPGQDGQSLRVAPLNWTSSVYVCSATKVPQTVAAISIAYIAVRDRSR